MPSKLRPLLAQDRSTRVRAAWLATSAALCLSMGCERKTASDDAPARPAMARGTLAVDGVELVLDSPAIARQPRDVVDGVLGEPSMCWDGAASEHCIYPVPASATDDRHGIFVDFRGGRAQSAVVADPRIRLADATAHVGLGRHERARVFAPGSVDRWEWEALPHAWRVYAFPAEGGAAAEHVNVYFGPPSGTCCSMCDPHTSEACGDACIARGETCEAEPGCACLEL